MTISAERCGADRTGAKGWPSRRHWSGPTGSPSPAPSLAVTPSGAWTSS